MVLSAPVLYGNKPVTTGHAVRIMTGAPVPSTCDTVIMQEQVVKATGEAGCYNHIYKVRIQMWRAISSLVVRNVAQGTVVIPQWDRGNLYGTD